MTQHVRTSYRRHPRAAWMLISGVLLLAAVALAIVIPAFGGVGDLIPPAAQPSNETPTDINIGGSNYTCPAGLSTFRVSNTPSSQTPVVYDSVNTASYSGAYVPLPAGVTFTLTGLNGQEKGKYFAFKATGVTVFYVAVKGGNDQALYDYANAPNASGGVTADGSTLSSGVPTAQTGLHSTPGNNGFNVASITTFCYAQTTTISGKVFLDNDGNGSFGTSNTPADTGLGGWSLALFRTSAPAGQVGSSILSASSGDIGSYTFTAVPTGADYKVCITRSGTWTQTLPTGAAATACSSPALPNGQPVTGLSGPASNVNFGVEPTVVNLQCGTPFSASLIGSGDGIVDFTAQLTAPPNTSCKNTLVMYSYLDSAGSQWASIHPPPGASGGQLWVVERVRWKVDKSGAQNPVTLQYDDDPTGGYGDSFRTMKMCLKDPRNNTEFGLALDPGDASVMPAGETTCEIRSTDLPSNDAYNYEAYLASKVDGLTGGR